MSLLLEKYKKESVSQMMEQYSFKSPMRVPRIEKVVLNMGVGEAVADKSVLDKAMDDLRLISGQKPAVTKARKSIAGFKIRAGWPIGCKVTLRKKRMWHFLDKLVYIDLPRVRDFRGLNPKAFNGHGDFSMGVTEQIVFPEINYEKIDKLRGLDITVTTTGDNDVESLMLLKSLGFPFRS